MTHSGKARQAGLKIILRTVVLLVVFAAGALVAHYFDPGAVAIIGAIILTLWILFVLFVFSFFRDPEPEVPADPELILAPAHGTVDVIEETEEKEFMGGRCRRISIFLSVLDIHVQNAPISGRIAYLKHCPGQFLNAMRSDCGTVNENVLLGFDSLEKPGEQIGVRLIAGLIARRIVPWVSVRDTVDKGERISLIQFGSRVDLYLPLGYEVRTQIGAKVRGGATVIAKRIS